MSPLFENNTNHKGEKRTTNKMPLALLHGHKPYQERLKTSAEKHLAQQLHGSSIVLSVLRFYTVLAIMTSYIAVLQISKATSLQAIMPGVITEHQQET